MAIRHAIETHAENCQPDECCGLLAADPSGRIRFAYPLDSSKPSPVSFTIDPDEHFGALRHAERQGWEISGVFHSHPGGEASPSATDVAMAFDPEWVHLILAGDELRAFSIRGGEVSEVEVGWVDLGS
jgi:proteasome lid subunit RPN8/RPN11